MLLRRPSEFPKTVQLIQLIVPKFGTIHFVFNVCESLEYLGRGFQDIKFHFVIIVIIVIIILCFPGSEEHTWGSGCGSEWLLQTQLNSVGVPAHKLWVRTGWDPCPAGCAPQRCQGNKQSYRHSNIQHKFPSLSFILTIKTKPYFQRTYINSLHLIGP